MPPERRTVSHEGSLLCGGTLGGHVVWGDGFTESTPLRLLHPSGDGRAVVAAGGQGVRTCAFQVAKRNRKKDISVSERKISD